MFGTRLTLAAVFAAACALPAAANPPRRVIIAPCPTPCPPPLPSYIPPSTLPPSTLPPTTLPPSTLPPTMLPPATTPPGTTPPGTTPPGTTPPGTTPPGTTPPTTPDAPTPPATPPAPGGSELATGGGEGGSDPIASVAPNMIGDLLGAGRSLTFLLNRERGPVFIEALGAASVVNPKVSENNSPIPRDRVSFRYNYFSNAIGITGLSGQTEDFPQRSLGGQSRPTETRDYDFNLYTFQFEKTFLDGAASAEFRLPIRTTLSSRVNYSAGTPQGIARMRGAGKQFIYYSSRENAFISVRNPNVVDADATARDPNQNGAPGAIPLDALNVNATPENTFGRTETELDNVSVVLKALLYSSDTSAFTAGVAVTAPTGRDTQFTVTDYLASVERLNEVDMMRVRDFAISRDTWAVSPFVAALYRSEDSRFFAQGFVQLDLPVGEDQITYTETLPIVLNRSVPFIRDVRDGRTNIQNPPFTTTTAYRDQTLLHVDVGTGYWLLRDQSRTFLNGIAPTVEFHYTTALTDAGLAILPDDPSTVGRPTGRFAQAPRSAVRLPIVETAFPAPSTVGNTRNRMDIVNLTVGTTFLLANQATVATAVALPLRGGDDRTFDWEFQLQLNWYFGGRNQNLMPNLFR